MEMRRCEREGCGGEEEEGEDEVLEGRHAEVEDGLFDRLLALFSTLGDFGYRIEGI